MNYKILSCRRSCISFIPDCSYSIATSICCESDSINLIKPKATAPTDFINASQINVSNGNIDIVLDSRDLTGDVGNINFYMYHKDTGAKVKVAVIKGRYEGDELVADFKIKGNIMFHCDDAEMNS